MKREYLDCVNGLTPKCPHWGSVIIDNLMLRAKISNREYTFSHDDIEAYNELCQDCDNFQSKR